MPPKHKRTSSITLKKSTPKKRCVRWQQVLKDYCTSVERPSLREFFEDNPELVKENTTNNSRARTVWINRFLKAVEAAKINDYLLDEPDWEVYGITSIQAQRRSTSSNYQAYFNTNEAAKFEQTFRSISNESKWKLSSGRYVEDVLHEFGKQCQFITPVHNFILDLEDTVVTALFSAKELEDIKARRPFQFDENLSEEVSLYIESLQKKRTFDELFEAINSVSPGPRTNPELYWVKKTLLSSLELFIDSDTLLLPPKLSERDIVRLVWSCLLNCCIGSSILVNTETEGISLSAFNDANRTIASTSSLSKQVAGELPDICFSYAGYELGFCEAERFNKGSKATKRLNETKIKLPIMMKKALARLFEKVDRRRAASIVGFYASELELEALTMCCPSGVVCLVTRSRVYSFPATLALFKKDMKKLVTLVTNMKKEMLKNVDLVVDDEDQAVEDVKLPFFTFPF